MVNPILETLQNRNLNLSNQNNFSEMLNMIKQSRNPQQLVMNMLSQKPQGQAILQAINQNGGNAKQLFYQIAQQRGINPNQFISMFK